MDRKKIKYIFILGLLLAVLIISFVVFQKNRVGTYVDRKGYIKFYNEDEINSLETENWTVM